MQFFKLLIFELEEHDLKHLLFSIIATNLAVLECTQWWDDYLLADCLQHWLTLQVVGVFDKVRHPSIIDRINPNISYAKSLKVYTTIILLIFDPLFAYLSAVRLKLVQVLLLFWQKCRDRSTAHKIRKDGE